LKARILDQGAGPGNAKARIDAAQAGLRGRN